MLNYTILTALSWSTSPFRQWLTKLVHACLFDESTAAISEWWTLANRLHNPQCLSIFGKFYSIWVLMNTTSLPLKTKKTFQRILTQSLAKEGLDIWHRKKVRHQLQKGHACETKFDKIMKQAVLRKDQNIIQVISKPRRVSQLRSNKFCSVFFNSRRCSTEDFQSFR